MLSEILARARQRADKMNLNYEGALTPQEAWQVLELAPASKLVDVRSYAELDLVGRIPQAENIEWAFYPNWQPNPDFITQLKMQIDAESLVMFICRTGTRSNNAASTAHEAGFTMSYNILEGFEGEPDLQKKQRGNVNGWRAAGLPWTNV